MQVRVGDGTAAGSEHSVFEISLLHTNGSDRSFQPPEIASIEPNQISSEGGGIVRLVGTSLDSFLNTEALHVQYGSGESAVAEVVSSTELVFIAPPILRRRFSFENTHGYFVLVRVTNLVDFWSNAVQLFIETPLKVFSISPGAGPACGGTIVSVLGQHFVPSISVSCTFGEGDGAIRVHADWRSPHLVQCTAPPWPLSYGEREVTVPFALTHSGATPSFFFRFMAPIVVSTMSPTMGPAESGANVTVYGFNFDLYDLACVIDSHKVPPVIDDGNHLRCIIPPHGAPTERYLKFKVVPDTRDSGNKSSFMRYELLGSDTIHHLNELSDRVNESHAGFDSQSRMIQLVRGHHYWLDQTDESNLDHPIALYFRPPGAHMARRELWTTGVQRLPSVALSATYDNTTGPTGAGVLSFIVPSDAPDIMYLASKNSTAISSDIYAIITNDTVNTSVAVVTASGSWCDPGQIPFRWVGSTSTIDRQAARSE